MYQWQHEPLDPRREVPPTWGSLQGKSNASPLLDSEFVSTALAVFGSGDELLFTCSDHDGPVCTAVLRQVGRGRWSTFQPSQAPLGFWLQLPGHSTAELLESLHRSMPFTAVMVSLTQQDPDLLPRPVENDRIATVDYIDTARIVVAGDWKTYWAERGSNLRHNVKRSKAKLASAGRSFRLRTITSHDEMRGAVIDYGRIESASWKASRGTAVSPDNDQGVFYTSLLERFAARHRAVCYQLLIDDEVAASDLCISGRDEIVILKTTFDDRFKEFSPAFLMREAAFEQIFEQRRYARIEFYGRVMDWHLRWTDQVRRMYHVNHFRLAILRRLAAIRSATASSVS